MRLRVQIDGNGPLVVFAHEFADDMTSWRDQVKALEESFRCATYNARGWPGSDAPSDIDQYTQAAAADDVVRVVEGAGRVDAHLVGLSMGSMAVLHCALRHPAAVRSLVLCGCGPGSPDDPITDWRKRILAFADEMERTDPSAFAAAYSETPARRRLVEKNPAAATDFIGKFASRPLHGPLMTLRSTISNRPLLANLQDQLQQLNVPVLVFCGDEDEACIETALFLKRTIPNAELAVLPRTGHAVNTEEPDLFNRLLASFLQRVEARGGQETAGPSA